MTEIRIHRAPLPADHFMVVTNDFMRGKLPVPLKALPRVLLGYFLSLPTGWRIDRESLDDSVLEGREAVTNALGALEDAAYLQRRRHRGQGGTWVWTYAVTDDPIRRPLTGSPSTGNPSMEPTSENSASSQVAPSPEKPSTENPSIRTEDLPKKTDLEDSAAGATGTPELPLDLPRPQPESRDEEKPPTTNQLAVKIAQRAYDRCGGLINMGATIKIAKRAIEAGYEASRIDEVMRYLHQQNWKITADNLRQQLEGGPRRPGTPPTTTPDPSRVVRTGRNGTGPVLQGYEGY